VNRSIIYENSVKNSQLVGAKPTGSGVLCIPFAEWERVLQTKSYMNFPIKLLQHMAKDKAISAECYMLWQQLYSEAFWNEGSITISKAEMAEKYEISETSVKKYLKKLINAGYLKISHQKSNRGYTASKITICLPRKLVELLEEEPDRKVAKKISKCGTVAEGSLGVIGEVAPKGGSRTRLSTYKNNKDLKHNNIDRDLASGKPQISSEPNSSVVFVSSVNQSFCQQIGSQARASEQKTQHSVGYVMQGGCAVGAGDSPSSSIGLVSSGGQGINFFDLSDDVVDEGKVREIAKNQQQIDKWQSELANMPKLQDVEGDWARYFDVSRKRGDYESWVRIAKSRIEVLEKSAKKEPIKLSNGKRRLSDHDCQKLNGVLVDAYKTKKITMSEARKTLRSMVDAILCGYYFQENVDVAKSVNSVIKKFRSDEWVNSGVVGKDKLSRPHPGWFDPEKYKVNSTRGL
jgi:biotin operon repressor